jgi:hypothetical protein
MISRICLRTNRARSIANRRAAQSIVIVTALLAWLVLTVENGAEQVDSGWAVAAPEGGLSKANGRLILGSQTETPRRTSTIATGSNDPQQQMILYHVLEQGRMPLLQKASPDPAPGSEKRSEGGVRFAVRPDGIEGWRSPGPIFAPLGEPAQAPLTAPQAAPTTAEDQQSSPKSVDQERPRSESATLDALEKSFTELLGEVNSKPAAGPGRDEPLDAGHQDAVEPAAEPAEELSTAPVSPTEPSPPPLTQQLIQLRSRVRSVLKGYYRRTLNSREHDPWEVMHGMLAYGVHSRVRQGGPRGDPITSVGWLCYNKPCKGLSMLYVTPKGELRAKYGVGLQGHLGQFLAMLAQCRVSADYPIHVGKNEFTIGDLIEAEMKTCYPKSELTFKLIALQYYLDLNHRWVNDQGVEWDIPRLIHEELAQPIRGAACGGTHRLSGLSLTVKTRIRRGEPVDGEYARAAKFIQKYHQYAFGLQNRDGSLSTAWFRGRGDDSDINRRIKTTGHILEWLCYSLSDEELREAPTIRAVSYLANLMYSKYDNDWEVGPMCHATHALLLYDARVFRPFDGADYDVAYKPRPRTATITYPRTIRR